MKKSFLVLFLLIFTIQNSHASSSRKPRPQLPSDTTEQIDTSHFYNFPYNHRLAKKTGFYHNNCNDTFNEEYLDQLQSNAQKILRCNKNIPDVLTNHLTQEIALRKMILTQRYKKQDTNFPAKKDLAKEETKAKKWQTIAQPWRLLFPYTISSEEEYNALKIAKERVLVQELKKLTPQAPAKSTFNAIFTDITYKNNLNTTAQPVETCKNLIANVDSEFSNHVQYESLIRQRRLNQAIVAGYVAVTLGGLGYWWAKSQK